MAVLYAVTEQPCSLGQLCDNTGLPRATVHRLAMGLEVHRLLARNSNGLWQPGPALPELAAAARDSLVDAATAILPQLRELTGESIQLYRREGAVRVCIASAEPPSGLRDTVPVGTRLPLTAGSAAKVLLAWAEPQVQASIMPEAAFDRRTLTEVHRRGWAQSAGERAAGVASVSAPVRNTSGDVIAAISVSGPIDRMNRRPGHCWAADLTTAADALSKHLFE